MQMRFDRGHSEAELLRQAFGGESLCYASQDLHLPRCQRYRAGALGKGGLFSYPAEDVWDHLPWDWALASDRRPKCPLQLSRPDVLKNVTRTAGSHHPQEIVTRLGYSPSDDFRLRVLRQ